MKRALQTEWVVIFYCTRPRGLDPWRGGVAGLSVPKPARARTRGAAGQARGALTLARHVISLIHLRGALVVKSNPVIDFVESRPLNQYLFLVPRRHICKLICHSGKHTLILRDRGTAWPLNWCTELISGVAYG